MTKYKILTDTKDKIFTYRTAEYISENGFIIFTDDRGVTRHIPLNRIIEVIEE